MRQHYKDILDRINEAPKWFDDYGVPRFEDFSPSRLSNIYANEAALAEVSCQNCGQKFTVALTDAYGRKGFSLSDEIRLRWVEYSDPPNGNCCGVGPSMTTVMHRILQYWSRDYEVSGGWQRDTALEGAIPDAPFDPPDTVAEVLAAAGAGMHAILVMCTSHMNRYDHAGRVAAALAGKGRVLIAYDERYLVVARKILVGLLPDADVGYHWKDWRTVALADFERLKDVQLSTFGSIVILAGPRPRNDALQVAWDETARRLATEARDQVQIEFALKHSLSMLASPDLVVDIGRRQEEAAER